MPMTTPWKHIEVIDQWVQNYSLDCEDDTLFGKSLNAWIWTKIASVTNIADATHLKSADVEVLHGSEVELLFIPQQPRVWFSAFLKICINVAEICRQR